MAQGWLFGAEFLPDNPFDSLTIGCDFLRNHAPACIDFASIHLWPDSWLPNGDNEEAALRFARRWINAHVDCCTSQLAKPLVLAEFGKKPAGAPRAAFYQKVFTDITCLTLPSLPYNTLYHQTS